MFIWSVFEKAAVSSLSVTWSTFQLLDMRLSDAGPSDYTGPSSSAEMRQKNTDTVKPFISRPAIYYGDGPFDPPSSDEDEEAAGTSHSSETDAESVSLLNVDKSGPSTPGRAERGDQSPHRTTVVETVRPFMVTFWNRFSHFVFFLYIYHS